MSGNVLDGALTIKDRRSTPLLHICQVNRVELAKFGGRGLIPVHTLEKVFFWFTLPHALSFGWGFSLADLISKLSLQVHKRRHQQDLSLGTSNFILLLFTLWLLSDFFVHPLFHPTKSLCFKPDERLHTCNLRTQEAEEKGSQNVGQLALQSENLTQNNLLYVRWPENCLYPCYKCAWSLMDLHIHNLFCALLF